MSILEIELEGLTNRGLPFDKYRNRNFLITGGTGLIGSLLVKSLLFLNDAMYLNIIVIAGIRNKEKARAVFGDYFNNKALVLFENNLGKGRIEYPGGVDFIIHTAAITTSKYMISNPVETIRTAVNGTEEILQLAQEKHIEGMVYVSSMEVYGQPNIDRKVTEHDLGYIDLTSPRSCYPEGKRMCEMLCTAYASEYGIPVRIARLAQTFGVGVLPTENRVFMQFARSVMNNQDIVLHTKGKSEGNYVYTFDAIAGILLLLTNGGLGEAYNISNEKSHVTIKEMAEMVCNTFGRGISKVVIDIPEDSKGYAPDVKMWLDNSKIKNIGWEPKVELEESYRRMIQWLKENEYNE